MRACEAQDTGTCGAAAAAQGATNPSAPGSLSTSGATVTGMTFTWTNPSSGHNESEVEVGYSATSSDTTPNAGQAFKAINVATHTFSGLNGGIEHKFFARTVVRNTETNAVLTSSAWQSETGTTTKPGAPTVTANTSTTNGGSEIDVTWPSVTGASAYQVRHIHSGGTQPSWPSTFVTSPHTVSSLSAGRIYDIQVRACGTSATSSCGTTQGSASEATIPTAVSNLGASNIGPAGLTLTWQQISGNNEAKIEVGYNTDTSATAPTESTVAEKAITAQNHAFTGLAPTTEYRFFARTVVKDSSDEVLTETAWQSINRSTTEAGAPGNLSATADGATKIDVDWDDVQDATHYQIRHKLGSTSAWPGWGTSFFTASEYEITSLSAGRRYDIQARGCTSNNVANCGAHSEVEGAPQPTTPTSVSTSGATATGMTLTWQAISTGNNEAVLEVGYNDDTSADAPDAGIAELTAINTAASHTFSGLSAGIQYKFFVRTKVKPDSGGGAPLSASAWQSENGTTSAPAKPSITAETDGTDRTTAINVTWSAVAGATRYQVRHVEDDGTALPAWGTSFINGTTHKITGLSTGRRYRIQARACGAAAAASCGAVSDTAKEATDPTAISSLDKSNVNAAGLTLTWSQISGNNEAAIQVGYNTDTGAGTPTDSTVTDKAISSQNHVFSGLVPSTSHKFFARTVVKDGNTVLTETNWQSLTESTSALGSPSPSAAADGTTKIDVTWAAVTSASHYQVRRKLGSASDWPGWGTSFISGTSHELTGLAAGRRYDIQARACTAAAATHCGAASTAIEGATVPTALAAPTTTGITASAVTLNWVDVSDNAEASFQAGYNTSTSATDPTPSTVVHKQRTETSHPFSGLTAGTSHKFFARTVVRNSAGTENLSASAWATGTASTTNAPVISTEYTNQTLGAGRTVTYPVAATDADGNTLQYQVAVNNNGGPSVTVSPTALTNLGANSQITVTMGATTSGTAATVTVSVTDGTNPVTKSFTVTVQTDSTPSFSTTQADLSFTKDQAITTVNLPAATSGNGTITYSLTPALPAGLSINTDTRQITGTPTAETASAQYTWKATDSDGSEASLSFAIEVVEPLGKVLLRSAASVAMLENGGTAEFTIHLNEAPDAGVTVTVASGATGTATVAWKSPDTGAFTTTNWETPQTVTVTGVNDDDNNTGNKRDATITLTAANTDSSNDSGYHGKTTTVTAQVVDDDHPTLNNAFWSGTMVVGESGGETGFKPGGSGHGLLTSGAFSYPGWNFSGHVVALGYSATHPGYLATAASAGGTHSARLIGDELPHVRLWMGSDPTAADFQSFKLSWDEDDDIYDLTDQAGDNLTSNPFTDGAIEEVFLVFQPPENVTLEVRNGGLGVSWTEAAASAITYQVQYKKSADATWLTASTGAPPTVDLTGLDNDVQYDVRVGLLISDANPYYAATVQATPKAAPTNVTATAASLTSATVSWTDVAAATSHVVRHRERGTDTWSTPSTATSPHTVTSLTTEKTYQFQVGAVYGSGANAVTSWSRARAVTLSRTPRNVEVAAGNGSLTVTWTDAPEADSHSVRHRVTSPQGAWTTVASKSSGYEITGLTNNTEYDVQVGGVYTGDSNSPYWSDTVKGTPAVVPPGNVEAHAGDAMAKVFWDEVSGATSYSVRYMSSGGSWTTLTGQTSPIEISSLTNGTAYDVQVGAVDGTTQWSASVSVTPTAGLPGVPVGMYLFTLTSTTARFIWSDTEDDFIAEHKLASASSWTQAHADDLVNPSYTFSGLTAGEDYLLRIRAKTAAGTSASAGPATDPILVNAAKTPGNITRTAGDTKITVTWDDVTGAGSYSVRHTETTDLAWTTATEKTSGYEITGLTNGAPYFVQAGAVLGGKTYWSAAGAQVRPTLPEGPHSNLAVQPRDGGLYATWTEGNVTGGLGFSNFYYRQGTSGNWTYLAACSGVGTPFEQRSCNVTGLTNGTVYQVRVHNASWDELIATGTPGPAPSGVTANAASATSLSIAWTDAPGATGHRLRHRATTAGNDGEWTLVTSPANPYTLSSLTAGTEYDIQVGADHGTSDGSSTPACDGKDACGTNWSATAKATPTAKRIVISESSLTLLENQQQGLNVSLSEAPSGDVTVAVASSDTGAATVNPASLTFTSTDWDTAQGVIITGVDDDAQNPGNKRDVTVTHTASSTDDSGYDGKAASAAVRVVDSDAETLADAFLSAVLLSGKGTPAGTETFGFYSGQFGALSKASFTTEGGFQSISRVGWQSDKLLVKLNLEERLPQRLEPLWMRLGDVDHELTWNGPAKQYELGSITTNPLPEDSFPEVHFMDPAPKDVAAAPDDAKITVTWTDAAGAASHQVRYKLSTASDWTEPSGDESSGYEITGLTNDSEYDVQVGAVYGTGANARTWWSATVKATPEEEVFETLFDTHMGVGALGNNLRGYSRHGTRDFGQLDDNTFSVKATEYSLVEMFTYQQNFCVRTSPDIPLDDLNALSVIVEGVTFTGGWTGTGEICQARGSLNNLTTDETVAVTIATQPATGAPAAPTAFTATARNGGAALAWTDPSNSAITKWQYRYKTSADYGTWTDVPSSSATTTSYTVTGLTNSTAYTFQVRAVATANEGVSSAERAVTPAVPVALTDATLTAAVQSNLRGYSRHGTRNFGSLDDDTFTHKGTSYTLTELVTYSNDLLLRTDPRIPVADLNALDITVGTTDFGGDWTLKGNGELRKGRGSFQFTSGGAVTLAIAPEPNSGTPAAPYGFTATAGPVSAALAWKGPTDSSITKWQYRQKTSGGYGNWTDVPSSGATTRSYTVPNLTADTAYTFQVRAFVSAGGALSVERSATPTGAPGNVEAHAGDAMAKVFWDELSGATSHSVRYKLSTANSWTTLTGQTSPIEISSLTNGTAYDVQVGAVSGGTTLWSASVSVTPTAGLPGVPTNSYLRNSTSTSARLLWHAAGAETHFTAEHKLAQASAWTQAAVDDLTGSWGYIFSGLTEGEDYLLRVRGKTAAGNSAEGPATDPILFNHTKTPGNITHTEGDTKITVTWDDVTGASSYSVRHTGSDPIAWTTATEKTSGYEITGLMNGTPYYVQVGAVLGGKTYWSAADRVTPTLPEVPHSNLAAQPRDGGLYVTWTEGNVTAGNAFSNFWYREGTSGDWTHVNACLGAGTPFEQRSCDLTGLTNGTAYQVEVRNVNWDNITATGTPGPAPSDVTVTSPTTTSLSVSWTNAPGATGHRLRHRATTDTNDGDWTVVTSPANPYTLSSLTTGTEYDIEVGADHGTSDGTSTPACDGMDACGTNWSAVKATPSAGEALFDTAMGVGALGNIRGYSRHGTRNFGQIDDNTFSVKGTEYTLVEMFTYQANFCVRTSPNIPLADLNTLSVIVEGVIFTGGWSGTGEICQLRGSLDTLPTDQTVAVTIAPAAPSNAPAAPAGFSATPRDGGAALAWNNPSNSAITKWQYRYKTSASYGAWTDVPSSSATTASHTVTGLTNDTAHTFQVRAVATANQGVSSIERPVTPAVPVALTDGTLTAGTQGNLRGYSRHGTNNFGSLDETTFTYRGTSYTLTSLMTWSNELLLQTDPRIPFADLKGLDITLGTTDIGGGWSLKSNGEFRRGRGSFQFTDGDSYTLAIAPEPNSGTPAAPYSFSATATAGNASADLAWGGPTDSNITKWQFRQKTTGGWGGWTDVPSSDKDTRSYTVPSLAFGTEYTFQIRGFTTAGGALSVERSATPTLAEQILLDTHMGVGALGGSLRGYSRHGTRDFGQTDDNTFTLGGTDYTLVELLTYNQEVILRTSPDVPLAALNTLAITVKGVTFSGGWAGTGERKQARGSLSLTTDETVAVTIATQPATGAHAAPTGFTATARDGGAALAWTDPSNSAITKWQYRYKTDASYSAWTDVPSSSATTTGHTVTGLTNDTAHTFQVRAVASANEGVPSAERAVTPAAPVALTDATLTAVVDGSVRGYSRHGTRNIGSLDDNTFTHKGTEYTLTELVTYNNDLLLRTSPRIPLADLNGLDITDFGGGWTLKGNGELRNGRGSFQFTDGDSYTLAIAPEPNSGTPAAPTGFTAAVGNAGASVALA